MLNLDDNVRVVQTASFAFLVVLLGELIVNFIVQARSRARARPALARWSQLHCAAHKTLNEHSRSCFGALSCVRVCADMWRQGAGKGNTDEHNTKFHNIPVIGDNFTQVHSRAATAALCLSHTIGPALHG